MSEFPEWIEEYFGLAFEPSYKQAKEIHRLCWQVDAGIAVDDSSEFSPKMWADLVRLVQAERENRPENAQGSAYGRAG